MSTSSFDDYRPPDADRPKRRRRRRRSAEDGTWSASGWLTGDRGGRAEQPVVPDAEFTSYYGRPVVKPAPWGHEIAAYLFLGGVAAGSALLAAGARLSDRPALRRNSRYAAMAAVSLSGVALVADLGRPARFVNMLRTVKLTSPMSVGTWIFSGFAGATALATAPEVDRLLGGRLPFRRLFEWVNIPASAASAALAGPLAAYTAVLLADTATPTWHAARYHLPFVFTGSAGLAAGGLAMITTPVAEAAPARRLVLIGTCVDLAAMEHLERTGGVEAEPLHHGKAGTMLKLSKGLALAGGVATLFGGRNRAVAVGAGLALLAASALTRFGVFEAGIHSAIDPRYTVEPQKQRLAKRRAAGVHDDSITTVR